MKNYWNNISLWVEKPFGKTIRFFFSIFVTGFLTNAIVVEISDDSVIHIERLAYTTFFYLSIIYLVGIYYFNKKIYVNKTNSDFSNKNLFQYKDQIAKAYVEKMVQDINNGESVKGKESLNVFLSKIKAK